MANKLRERYPGLKASRVPKAVFMMDMERDIIPAEEMLITQYGFLKEEVNFVMKYVPKFVLVGSHAREDTGIKVLQ